MKILHLDYETRNPDDLSIVGLDRYATGPAEVILAAYAFGDGPVNLWQPHLTEMPRELKEAFYDPDVLIWCWNAEFERVITKWVLNIDIPVTRFRCAMAQARYLSLPGSLEECGQILGLKQDEQKIADGKRLLKMFSLPAKAGGEETLFGISEPVFRTHESDPVDWQKFCEYNIQDVVSERAILNRMVDFPMPIKEWEIYFLDQKINDFGIPCDMPLINNAAAIAERIHKQLEQQLKDITKLENPNSRDQLLAWARERGFPFNTLGKAFVNLALNEKHNLTNECRRVLEIRKQSSKTFDTKFDTLKTMVGSDGRLRYQFSYAGASRTLRWSGHGVQPQNLTRPNKELEKRVDEAVQILRIGDYNKLVSSFKSDPLDVLAGSLRSSFKAEDGKKLAISDLSAIETRVGAWVAGCKPLLQVFLDGKCPYLTFACELYGIDYKDLEARYNAKDPTAKEMRQNAKPAILGAIFRLGGGDEVVSEDGDTIRTGLWGYARNLGVDMTRDLAHKSVEIFRKKYDEIVQFWYNIENASLKCVQTRHPQQLGYVRFELLDKVLKLVLPSGRSIHYLEPSIEERPWFEGTKKMLVYWGNDQRKGTFTRISTHGGKLTENVVQAIARDILAEGLLRADKAGFPVILHAHDEICSEINKNSSLGKKQLEECMSQSISWLPNLPLAASAFESEYYKKE